jgi:excisionase family DNA binding protein
MDGKSARSAQRARIDAPLADTPPSTRVAQRAIPIEPERAGVQAGSAQLPRLVDIGEVAVHLGVSVRHVRRLVAERRIPYVKWGNLLRFDPLEVSSWLALRSVDPLVHGRRDRRAI